MCLVAEIKRNQFLTTEVIHQLYMEIEICLKSQHNRRILLNKHSGRGATGRPRRVIYYNRRSNLQLQRR